MEISVSEIPLYNSLIEDLSSILEISIATFPCPIITAEQLLSLGFGKTKSLCSGLTLYQPTKLVAGITLFKFSLIIPSFLSREAP